MTTGFMIAGGIVAFYFLFVLFLSAQRSRHERHQEGCMIRVAVSRTNEKGPIVMEQVFAALHGLHEHWSLWRWLSGFQQPRVSFEIAAIDGLIQFYIWMPRRFKTVVESQIYAQYPDVEIEEVPDYTLQAGLQKGMERLPVKYDPRQTRRVGDTAVTAELKFEEPLVYPIKRFAQFEDKLTRVATETLAGVTATLTKLGSPDEQAWIQITIQPLGDWWRKRGLKCLKLVNRGLFRGIFWLETLSTNIYLVRGFWKRLFLSPFFFFFWAIRGKGLNILEMESAQDSDDKDLDEQVSRTHDREDPISAGVDKVTQLSFDANIRVVYLPKPENLHHAEVKVKEIAGSFKQFNIPSLNGFKIAHINEHNRQIFRRYLKRAVIPAVMVMNVEELATIFHMPQVPEGTTAAPNIFWVTSRKLEPPHNLPKEGNVPASDFTLLGASTFRGVKQRFGIKDTDRRRHMYVIGKTGMGKSTLLENMLESDILRGKGVAVIDPHGDLADRVIDFVPAHRTNDVVIVDPSDVGYPIAFNMLESSIGTPEHRGLIASGLLGVFKKMYAESWGPRLEHILRNTILALTEFPGASMLGIMRILVDNDYRRKVLESVENPMVRSFWIDEFGKMEPKFRTEAISPIQNKVGQFLSSHMIRNIVGQSKSTMNIRFMMDSNKIIIVNLSKGKIGEDNSSLLGSMLITKFQLDAMSRADVVADKRTDFYLYVDEFQNFATESFATILSEARKYKLNLTMANQYIEQMSEEVRDAVFGNVGTIICFQVGFDDAEYFSSQFSEEVLPNDIVTLPKYHAYTKLLIDGMPSKTFSVATLPPPDLKLEEGRRDKIIRLSRERYARPREEVEDKIKRWSESGRDRPEPAKLEKGEKGLIDQPIQKKPPEAASAPATPPKKYRPRKK